LLNTVINCSEELEKGERGEDSINLIGRSGCREEQKIITLNFFC